VRSGHSGRGEVEVLLPEAGIDIENHVEEIRRRYMLEAMERTHGVQTRAAEMLGMTFRSFRYFAKKYGLTSGREPGARRQDERPEEAFEESEEFQTVD
jgi:DNA-binding NtrC family response regulator